MSKLVGGMVWDGINPIPDSYYRNTPRKTWFNIRVQVMFDIRDMVL